MRGARRSLSFAIVAIMLAVSCGAGPGGTGGGTLTKVRLQLQWVAQSQFAGYYAALDKGYFKDLGLDVEIKLGGPDIVPQQVVASDAAEFGIAWVPKMLASREAGADLVNIAQVFQRSGTLEVSFKDKNITKPEDWKGKKVGTWGFGNEPELYAAMRKVGIDPTKASDVNIVAQPFDMSLLLNGRVDARQGSHDLAAERDQRAHLAVAERHRHARQGGVGPDRQHLDDVPGPEEQARRRGIPHRPRQEGSGRPQVGGRGHQRQRLQESDGAAHS